jgi:hypothetical protein
MSRDTAAGVVVMPGKYGPLAQFLREAAAREQHTVEPGFDDISELVGGLPASAQVRQGVITEDRCGSLAQPLAQRRRSGSRPPRRVVIVARVPDELRLRLQSRRIYGDGSSCSCPECGRPPLSGVL